MYYEIDGRYKWVGTLKDIYGLSEILSKTIQELYQEYIVKFPKKEQFNPINNSNKMVVERISFTGEINEENIRVIDYAFTRKPIYKVFQNLLNGPTLTTDSSAISKIRVNLNKLNDKLDKVTLYAERLLLAIVASCFHLTSSNEVNLDLVISRIVAIRSLKNTPFCVADSLTAEKIFKQKLSTYESARKKYEKVWVNRCELVLAGGDATRYLKLLEAISSISSECEELTEEFLQKMQTDERYYDIKHLLNIEMVEKVFETPIFKNVGVHLTKTDNNLKPRSIKLPALRILIDAVLAKFDRDKIPKALNYAFSFSVGQKEVFISFFMATLIRMYAEIIEEKSLGNYLYYMVKNKRIAEVLKEIISKLQETKILDKDLLDVRFITNIEGSLPLTYDKNYLVFDKQNHLKTTSTGHGPAFIKASEQILTDLKGSSSHPVVFSVRTIDNSGTDIAHFSGLTQKGAMYENNLRNDLVDSIMRDDKEHVFSLINHKPEKIITKASYIKKIIGFIEKRWDFRLDLKDINSFEEIAERIKALPITVAIVLGDHKSAGGGLNVNKDGQMAIVDKYYCLDDEKILSKFNPMLFSTIITKPYNKDMDSHLIFISKKNKKEVLSLQGESAATHIATDPKNVLKRIIEISGNKVGKAFADQKTLDQSHNNSTKEMTKEMQKDFRVLAKKTKISMAEIIIQINNVQEKAIDKLLKANPSEELYKQIISDKINDFFIPYGQLEPLKYQYQKN
ncbi:MAG: hypothetical protein A2Y40_07800 [Candidatus Margulisbacteria bacterium GWF2_35_9]|nr:MAG: hypothetical protein A2Y40_07800 [Candidatus Margulisbacteria bacterium GWF2_35_9]